MWQAPIVLRKFKVLGVEVTDLTMDEAVALLERLIVEEGEQTHSVYYVNTHTLNTAVEDPSYLGVLQRGDVVFGDGTGVNWATRMLHGARLQANVNGTDMTPRFFAETAGKGYRYFMLGTRPESIGKAAAFAQEKFRGWELAGAHHGYVQDAESSAKVVEEINAAKPHLLLVGMGNPLQESWIDRHKHALKVPLCIGIGGLFDYWSGEIVRAPMWMRKVGHEWVHLLLLQPRKAKRYLLGNPMFLLRVAKERAMGALSPRRPDAG